jgi:SAM-dependent methyltransferase/uncharacterized protein YbaR (Trm112 family)
MFSGLLNVLRCPVCGGTLELAGGQSGSDGSPAPEVGDGTLHCSGGHSFPVVRGIPRMLTDGVPDPRESPDGRTSETFSHEWSYYEPGDRTWGIDLEDRVRKYFLESVRIPRESLAGMRLLDAGCGNGSQSVAYTEFGLEVVAIDLSSGLEHGRSFAGIHPGARPDRVHFVQADLRQPPLAPASFDVIHSAGVLHHTPDTEYTFRRLCPLLRPGGTFYVWLYKYEPIVTPVVTGIRAVTRRVPPSVFGRVAGLLAPAFRAFRFGLDRLGVRTYPPATNREAALALIDIFGAPHAHHHTYDEVAAWFRSEGFEEIWPCNDDRRGFGVCGRRSGAVDESSRLRIGQEQDPALSASS